MDTKRMIIDTSYALFQQYGYDNVSVNDICDTCGITKPTFYKYIGSKDNILSYFFEPIRVYLVEKLKENEDNENYWEQIWISFKAIMDRCRNLGSELYKQLYIANLHENRHTFEPIWETIDKIVICFKRAQISRQINNHSDAKDLYNACCSICFGQGVLWAIDDGNFDMIDSIKTQLEAICEVDDKYKVK